MDGSSMDRNVPVSAGSSAGRSAGRGRAVRLRCRASWCRHRRRRRGSRASFCRFHLRGVSTVLSFLVSLSLSLSLSLSSHSLFFPSPFFPPPPKQHQNIKQRTNNGLRVLGARRPKAELAQRRPRLGADGVQAALGRLQAALALAPARGDVGVGVGTCHGWLVGWSAGWRLWARGGRWVCVTRVSSTGCVTRVSGSGCVLSL
jgi:hypothetical protein